MPVWVYIPPVARAPTTADVFNAIAEPRRRQVIDLLARNGPTPVAAIARALSLPQPALSKHLRVLRVVGVVTSEQRGQQRLYRLDAAPLQAVHEWASTFERFWTHHLDRIRERAERAAKENPKP